MAQKVKQQPSLQNVTPKTPPGQQNTVGTTKPTESYKLSDLSEQRICRRTPPSPEANNHHLNLRRTTEHYQKPTLLLQTSTTKPPLDQPSGNSTPP
ncbi:hypothetical protein QL285_078590 [Trifolium repens]|nr:hypothetical protein QL285_078590 [Trifolium repens]